MITSTGILKIREIYSSDYSFTNDKNQKIEGTRNVLKTLDEESDINPVYKIDKGLMNRLNGDLINELSGKKAEITFRHVPKIVGQSQTVVELLVVDIKPIQK